MADNHHQIEDMSVDGYLGIISINDLLGKFISKSVLYNVLIDYRKGFI